MPNQKTHRPRKTSAKKPAASGGRRKKERHLPAAERAQELLEAAIELFASKGPAFTFQNLADRVNVTQPLVHRYFPTKDDLITAIRETLQDAHWDPALRAILTDRSRPLEERIIAFYELYLPHIYRRNWYRGFWFFALNDPSFAQFYLQRVTSELLCAIIDEARFTFGFPSIDEIPPHAREVELVWGMHSTPIFQGVRRYVYEMTVALDCVAAVRDHVRAYLLAVPAMMTELMGAKTSAIHPPPGVPTEEVLVPAIEAGKAKPRAQRAS
jgi:AcrR family transcriptional regulator